MGHRQAMTDARKGGGGGMTSALSTSALWSRKRLLNSGGAGGEEPALVGGRFSVFLQSASGIAIVLTQC